jgi:hypothetical protein
LALFEKEEARLRIAATLHAAGSFGAGEESRPPQDDARRVQWFRKASLNAHTAT